MARLVLDGRLLWPVLLLAAGCTSEQQAHLPVSRDTPLAAAREPANISSQVTRMQRPEQELGGRPPGDSTVPAPPKAPSGEPLVRVSVRAWVNGQPIFDDELYNMIGPYLSQLNALPEPQRSAKQQEVVRNALDVLIDREVIYQDATRKLKNNKRAWDKITEMAGKAFEKQLRKIKQDTGRNDHELKDMLQQQGITLESLRRQKEREYIATEYMKSRIYPLIEAIGRAEIRDYYEQHLNEFQSVDRVKWQNIFIAVGPKVPTPAAARQFADQLVARLRAGEDFTNLLQFDDGVSRDYRKGYGEGELHGQIKPVEVEQYLWNMADGEIGPPVELSTGVHVFRLVKRDHAGQMPFNEDTQTQIRAKLRNEIFARENKRIMRELRSRAIIDIEQGRE